MRCELSICSAIYVHAVAGKLLRRATRLTDRAQPTTSLRGTRRR
jgi:hypothetical protein